MKHIVIIGAGTHGRDIAECLKHPANKNKQIPLGFIDDDPKLTGKIIDGIPVLGDVSWFEKNNLNKIETICGSGFSKTRKEIAVKLSGFNLGFANVISPLAYISSDIKLGKGIFIGHSVTLCRGGNIGNHTLINYGSQVGHDHKIGDFVTINPGVNLAGNVLLDEGGFIGIGATVIQGIKIGKWSVVGAGTVVLENLPENVTAVGVPAKIIKKNKHYE